MAKVKNKRNAGLADKVHAKKREGVNKKKLNPFEVHINREKLKVLGKKSKHDKGLPGVSRAKAVQKRKETIGTEMKLMNKTNSFIDRRIGERDSQLSPEERMIARFAAERAKQHSKKNIYNLADDEILTHRGQTLEQIEKFDDPRSSDDEDDMKKFGGLDDDFVSEGHFGGGVLTKSDSKDGAKSHKDLIEQLIAESKKRKAEKQKEKEQTLDLTEKLDSEWKDLQPVVLKRQKVEEVSVIDKLLASAEKGQDYDKMMRELRFEKRGTPSDGLKNMEKQQAEERKKLEEMEKHRQQRMMPEEEVSKAVQPTNKHRSADDLDDNFDLDNDQEFMLAYDKDGKPLVPEHVLKDFSVPNNKKSFEDGVSDTSSDDDNDDDDDEDEESDEETSKIEDKIENTENDLANETDNTSVDTDPGVSDTYQKSFSIENPYINKNQEIIKNSLSSDNKDKVISDEEKKHFNSESGNLGFTTIADNVNEGSSDGESSDDIENDNDTKLKVTNNAKKYTTKVNKIDTESTDDDENYDDETDEDDVNDKLSAINDFKHLEENERISEDELDEAEMPGEIKSFFDFKTEECDNLRKLLDGKSPSQQSAALQKLIKSYDPSLSQSNKDLLSRLFAHLLQYINDIFSNLNEEPDVIKSFLIFHKLVPHFYDLVHTNKVSTKKFFTELLKEKHDLFKRKSKVAPNLDTLIFFKLVSIIYPTSDFRHPVTTPSLIFMSEILTLSRFSDRYSISRGLFVTSLILEYTVLSKRYVPAAINFLRGILYLCANTTILNPIKVVPPFRLHRDVKILNIDTDCSKMAVDDKMAAKDFILQEIDDDFKIRCLLNSSLMVQEFFDNYNDIDAQAAIFEPHIKLLGRVELDLYPKKVRSKISKVIQHMKQSLEVKTYTPLAREKVRPKALRLYEPDIQAVFTGSKNAKLSKEQAERVRLQGKYKKEMKGALREIRRDKAYVASVKIRQKIHSDNIRKEKVKQIYKDASIQQGELNKLKRMK